MANKITINGSLIWTDGVQTLKASVSQTVDQTNTNAIYNLQNIGTTAEAILLGDVSPGYLSFKNLDTTNFVLVGNDNAVATVVAKLLPGQGVILPTTNATWYAKADTAECVLLVFGVDV